MDKTSTLFYKFRQAIYVTCTAMVMENGEHWFHTEEQLAVLDTWHHAETE